MAIFENEWTVKMGDYNVEFAGTGKVPSPGDFKNNYTAYQYLTSRNIALDVTLSDESGKPVTYSVEKLVKEGIFKIIEG